MNIIDMLNAMNERTAWVICVGIVSLAVWRIARMVLVKGSMEIDAIRRLETRLDLLELRANPPRTGSAVRANSPIGSPRGGNA